MTLVSTPAADAAEPARLTYRPQLDGLRGMAVIAVFLYHAEQFSFSGGFLGVDLFFVLSGYLITRLLIEEHNSTSTVKLAEFWARRIRRLLPAMLVMLITVVIVWPTFGGRSLGGDALSVLFYVANWRFISESQSYFADITAASPLQHTWSLAIEEQFYIVWPALFLLAMVWLRLGRRAFGTLLVVASLFSALSLWVNFSPANPTRAYFSTLSRSHEILVGAFTAIVVTSAAPVARRVVSAASFATPVVGLAILFSFVVVSDDTVAYYHGGSLAFAIGVAIVLLGLESTHGAAVTVLSAKPLVLAGRLSYGIYLWHWPIIVYLISEDGRITTRTAVTAALATLLIAVLSYRVIEEPIRHGRLVGLELTNRRLAIAAPASMALAAAIVLAATSNVDEANWVAAGNDAVVPVAIFDDSAPTLGVIGDSVIVSLLPGIQDGTTEAGWNLVSAAQRGCSAAGGFQVDNDGNEFAYSADCDDHVPGAFAAMIDNHDPDVILWYSGRENDASLRTPFNTVVSPGSDGHRNQLAEGIDQSLDVLTERDAVVVIVEPLPLKGVDPTRCADGTDTSITCERVAHLEDLTVLLGEAAASRENVVLTSAADIVCGPPPLCPRIRDGVEYRPDGGHFDDTTARLVGPQVVERVLDAAATSPRSAVDEAPKVHQPAMEAFETVRGSSVNDDSLGAADDFMNGTLRLGKHSARIISEGVDWISESDSRSYLRLHHGHFIVNDLVAAHDDTGDTRYLAAAYAHIESWLNATPSDPATGTMAWHDETTARRLVNWLGLLRASDLYPDQTAVVRLAEEAEKHAALLATDEFHTKGTNHGMFQDEALLAYSAAISPVEEAVSYRRLATKRLKEYFEVIISDDGVHLEHSPGYHQLIAAAVLRYSRFYDAIGDAVEASEFRSIVDQMTPYATAVIKPDGQYPLLGDTFAWDEPRPEIFNDPEFRFAATRGSEGVQPTELDAVFPDAGYAIFRDRWGKDGEGIYINFTAAYHTSYHKHSDDLSLWVYHDGDLLTEAGPNGYDYDDPVTEFAYSSNAHNTILVDGVGLERVDGFFERTRFDDFELGDEFSTASGINARFDGVVHHREVTLDRTGPTLLVTDRIDTESSHEFTLLWHTAPGIEARLDDRTIELFRSGKLVARLLMDGDDIEVSVDEIDGDPVKSLRLGGDEPTPSHVVAVRFSSAESAVVVTRVELLSP